MRFSKEFKKWACVIPLLCVLTVIGTKAGSLSQGGGAPSGSAVQGNPNLIAGRSNAGNSVSIGVEPTTGVISTLFPQAGGDAISNSGMGQFFGGNAVGLAEFGPFQFNGTTWDRERNAALANFGTSVTRTATNSIGAALAEKGARWSVVSIPASGTQGSASLAAEASVRHVIDCISFSANAAAAVAATNLNVNVRDGATGAGTVIYSFTVSAPTAAGAGIQEIQPVTFCGLQLTGTTNTATTVEFSAGLTGLLEAVSFTGFNVN